MRLNIAHKIFSIAIIALILMVITAALSLRLTARISDELDFVAAKQLPLSDTIGRINVQILEQGVLLQQLFALPEETPAMVARIKDLGTKVNRDFEKVRTLFKEEEASEFAPPTIFELHRSLDRVEQEFRTFEKHSFELLELRESGKNSRFLELLPHLNKQQNTIDDELNALRSHVEAVVEESVQRADSDEKFLLWFHLILTGLSAVLGLGIAAVVTKALVRNVRNLVRGAEDVEAGDLDVEVPVITDDEVGRLTASFNDMVGGLRMKERIKDTFGKYMDPRIVTALLEKPEMTRLGGDRREMTVMFIDLQGYTSISEKLAPDDLVRMLNHFLGQMADAIAANHGVVNDFLGDAVMAYWGPPFTSAEEQAELACKAALAARENFKLFTQQVSAELGEKAADLELEMRVGVSSGEVVAGNIGSSVTRKYSVIGDPVNLGARLEGANKNYGTRIILSERTRVLAGDAFHARELDLIRVKGKDEPTRIFELLATKPDSDLFASGLAAYRAQDWAAAEHIFNECQAASPDDPVPSAFLSRIPHLKADPPGPGWDGVWEFQTK